MPKKQLTRRSDAEEEGLRLTGSNKAARHPQHRDAQDLLDQQAPARNIPGNRPPVRGRGGVGPDTTT